MRHGHLIPWGLGLLLVTVGLLLVGCQPPSTPTVPPDTPVPPTPTATPQPTATPTSTPTPLPPKELTICQAEEPDTLFLYGGPSRAGRNVLEAVYDGPIDSHGYRFQPVILTKLPSLEDGDAALRTVIVREGETVADVNGQIVDLVPGVAVVNGAGREVTFEGGAVTMTQIVVTFTLRPDITWADGEPLTADDSIYSFELAGEFDSPTLQMLRAATAAYDKVDEHTVVWTGTPGYRDTFYFLNFYTPLPRHVWAGASAERLLSAEVAHRRPLGWGPFAVEEWKEGEYITLVRNPHYFRAAEGLPHLDRVTFRFVPDLQQALDMLAAGECDLITQDVIESGDISLLLQAADAGQAEIISSSSSEWEHLDFGIAHARWVRKPSFFADVRVRQAVAQCIEREKVAGKTLPYGGATVAHSYVPPEHPLYAGDSLYRWSYDLFAARSLLDEIGWRDEDGDGLREAHGVPGIANYTPFTVTLLTTGEHPARRRAVEILKADLAACGIGVGVRYLPAEEFFADGPDGPIFGRQFDLALFSWLNGLDAPCELYLSSEIPTQENWWAASNDPGYTNDEYDAVCQAALNSLAGTEDYFRYHREAQRIFSHDLPALPLYFAPKLVAVRPGVTGVVLDPSEYLELWNIEEFDLTE